jgi:DNA recombination protein RmuC
VWRQDRLAENVDEIHRLGKELHLRLSTMGGHVSRLGRDLDSAVQSYNRTVSSLESRVLVTARRLGELQGADGDDHGLSSPEAVEATVRATRSIELAGEPITERSA